MLLVLLLPALSIAKQCIGLTIEGGGCKGAYSAAVIKAMTDYLPAADLEYNIITGVSAGALNTGAYSQFSIGDEAKMADFALGIWESVKGPGDIFEPWPLWPPVDVFFQRPALFSTEPLRRLINNHVFGDIKRPVTVGTTNIDKGEFVVIDNEVGMEKFQEAMLCSSSFPVAFPHQSYDFYGTGKNTTYADGCVTINLDVATPINWCLKNGY